MTHEAFQALLENRLNASRAVLASKSKEYSTGGDKLHNFKRAAEMQRTTQAKALLGMMTKHLVSVIDMVDSDGTPTDAWINEKIGDTINYMILLEAVWRETK